MALTIKYNGVTVTSEAFDVNLRRGRNRQLDEFEPVSGSVMFRNFNGAWTAPFLATPQYLLKEDGDFLLQENGDKILLEQSIQAGGGYGQIELGGTLTIDDGTVRVFTGHVEDINYRYEADGYTDARVILGDGLTTLGNSQFATEWVPPDDQYPGDRLNAAMAQPGINFPAANRDFEQGQSKLQGGYIPNPDPEAVPVARAPVPLGTNALQYCQLVSRSEYGKFYITRMGMVIFKGRYDFPSDTPLATIDDTGANVGFSGVNIEYGSELLRSAVTVERIGGTPRQAFSPLALPDALGERNLTISGLLLRHDPDCAARAQFLAEQYSSIDARVAGLKILLDDLGTSDREDIAALDINDTIEWTWTPPGTSDPVTQLLVIEGVTYAAELYGNTYVELQLSNYPNTNYFTLDTDSLDSGVPLGF